VFRKLMTCWTGVPRTWRTGDVTGQTDAGFWSIDELAIGDGRSDAAY